MDISQGAARLVQPVLDTWNAIGHDFMSSVTDTFDPLTNEDAIEACLGADRLLINGSNAQAHQLCRELCMEHGFARLVSEIAKHVTLI